MAEETIYLETSGLNILDLPSIPLSEIFSYLRPPDLRNCALTCKAFLALSKDPVLWKVLYPTQWAYGLWSKELLDSYEVNRCRISECQKWGEVDDRVFQVDDRPAVFSKCHLVEHNVLSRILEHLVPYVGFAVQELYFNCSDILNDHLLRIALIHCPNLVVLNLRETDITEQAFNGLSDFDACRKLQVLDLSYCTSITDTTIRQLITCWHEQDDITHTNSQIENTLSVINVTAERYQFPKESSIHQSYSNKDVESPIQPYLIQAGAISRTVQLPNIELSKKRKCSGLRSLNLSSCCILTNETLYMLMAVQPVVKNLAFLDLSGCYNMTGGAICDFVNVCPKLKPEDLYYCDHVLLGPYTAQANGCSHLQEEGCCVAPEF